MAWRPYKSKSDTWLTDAIDRTQDELADGASIIATAGGDTSMSQLMQDSIRQRLQDLLREAYLRGLTGWTDLADVRPITRTRVAFNC
jgi:hypothetical protein